jgi:predicted cupin superfamily sugar epimerase
MDPTAEEIIALLGLQRHPTCGYVAETFRSPHHVLGESLPAGFSMPRPLGSVLYFLVTPDAPTMLHSIRSDQMYHHYLGDPLEVLLLYQDGTGEVRVLGDDLLSGLRPQLLIPGGTIHASRPRGTRGYALLGTSEWLGVEPQDVLTGRVEELMTRYPAMRDALSGFAGGHYTDPPQA